MDKPDNITKNDWEILKTKYKGNENYLHKKLSENYPIQYLIGNVNFYGLNIKVDERVFIPRFETEQLVEKTIKIVQTLDILNPKILDVCTGSGCIAIALNKFIANSIVDGIEISEDTIELAKENARINNVNIKFVNNDIKTISSLSGYNIIISNPPYVDVNDNVGHETRFEPQIALYALNKGLEFYETILQKADKQTSLIAFEIGDSQGEEVAKLAKKYFPGNKIIVEKDYSERDRFVFIIKTV